MNEKIKKLAKQTGLSHMPSNYSDIADLYKGADFELEKFAELIIRECCREIQLECYDFANGDCFRNVALWESVTREYGKNKERGFDPT